MRPKIIPPLTTTHWNRMEVVFSGLLFAGFFVAYFFPTIIAECRGHPNGTAIGALNTIFGWTLIGWAVALIWSLTHFVKPYPRRRY